VEGARPGIRAQFGFAVTDRREAPGLTREEFAARAGIHRTYLSDIERGPRNVRSYEAPDPEKGDGSFIEACAVGPVPSLSVGVAGSGSTAMGPFAGCLSLAPGELRPRDSASDVAGYRWRYAAYR